MKKLASILPLLILVLLCAAQRVSDYIARGNSWFQQQQYEQAEAAYRQALMQDPGNEKAQYNLAASLVHQDKLPEAQSIYTGLTRSPNDQLRSGAYYNQGVLQTKQQQLEPSIESYKNALRINPTDMEARENLQKALLERKKNQSQQNQQQKSSQQQSRSKMSQREAEQKLKLLEQKEKNAQERLQKQKERGGSSLPKDW